MQLFWLLPSLGFGVILGFVTGQWMMAGFAALTVVSLAIGLLVRQNQSSVSEAEPIHWGNARVAIGNRKLARQSWFWKPEVRKRLISQVLAENRSQLAQLAARERTPGRLAVTSTPGTLKFFGGFREASEFVADLVSAGPHAFICGPTGSGKSQYLKLMLQSLVESHSEAQLELVTIDFKGGATLRCFESRAIKSATDLDQDISPVLLQVQNLLAEREVRFSQLGIARIEQDSALPRVVVAVDELAHLLQRRGALEVLESVAARGRSLGVHLVATAQSTSGISRSLLVNLSLRVATGKLDPLELAQLGIRSAQNALKPFDGMLTASVIGNSLDAEICFPIISTAVKGSQRETTFEPQRQPIRLIG